MSYTIDETLRHQPSYLTYVFLLSCLLNGLKHNLVEGHNGSQNDLISKTGPRLLLQLHRRLLHHSQQPPLNEALHSSAPVALGRPLNKLPILIPEPKCQLLRVENLLRHRPYRLGGQVKVLLVALLQLTGVYPYLSLNGCFLAIGAHDSDRGSLFYHLSSHHFHLRAVEVGC